MREDESLDSREPVEGRVVFRLSRYALLRVIEGGKLDFWEEKNLWDLWRIHQKDNEFWRILYTDEV